MMARFSTNPAPSLEYLVIPALLIGFFSTLHCVGMCGGIMGALSFSLAPEIRAQRLRLVPYLAAYNVGRIGSYTLAGAIVGGLGGQIYEFLTPQSGHLILQGLAALLMAAIGLYVAGWFPKFAYLERLGTPIWRRLEPLGRHLLPVTNPFQALLYGIIWGWLPCGLVYSTLIWITVISEGAWQGALYMASFGVGTLPIVLSMGILAQWVAHLRQVPYLRQAAGLTLIAMALAGIVFGSQLEALSVNKEQSVIQDTGR